MVDHPDGNLRVLQDVEIAWILAQLDAANQVEGTEDNARWNLSCYDQYCVFAVIEGFDDESVVLDPIELQFACVVANPTRCIGRSQEDSGTGDVSGYDGGPGAVHGFDGVGQFDRRGPNG